MFKTRPREFSSKAERTHYRLEPQLDKTAHAGIGANPAQDDHLAARAQHARKLVERRFRIGYRRHDVLRHYDIERIVREFELLRVHDGETFDILQAEIGDPLPRL